MTSAHDSEQSPRGLQVGLLLLYLLFVIYGSLVPLRYVDRSMDDAIRAFQNIPFLQLGIGSRADWVANLLLFIPLTFLASLVMNSTGGLGRRVVVGVGLVAFSALLSVGIEFTQLFFPQRTVSQNDIFAESVGGMVGVICHGFFGLHVQTWLHSFRREQRQQHRVTKLLHAYLGVLLVFNILPLDLTLSPVELFHKWNEGRITLIPFVGARGGFVEVLYATTTDVLIWLAPGVLWALQPGATIGRVLLRGVLAAAAIEMAQLFVYSRFTDINQVIHAAVGVGAGWLIVQHAGKSLPVLLGVLARHWKWLWLIWAVLTAGVFWFPFNISVDELSVQNLVAAFTRVPFTTYYFGSEYRAINELLRKVGFFLPGGLLLGLTVYRVIGGVRRVSVLPLVMLGLFAFVVELGQLALPGKVADLTDALLEFSGGALGYWMALWVGVPGASQTLIARPRKQVTMAWIPGYKAHLLFAFVLSLIAGALLTDSRMPYNVRELMAPGLWGVVSVGGLTMLAYGMANGPFFLFSRNERVRFLWFPIWIVAHGLLAWCLLRVSVPIESLYDLVGSPVLDWPWEWELLGRYLALHISVMLQILGGVLFVRVILVPATLGQFLYWVLACVVFAWPLYFVVVQWAATDNLTELMADYASFLAASALVGAWFMTSVAASAISAALSAPRRSVVLVVLAMCAAIAASLLYWMGAEHTIVKYGRVFSAFQFLLSTGREHYAHGTDLVLRYAVALLLVCGGLAAMQWLSWRWLCLSGPRGGPSRRQRFAVTNRRWNSGMLGSNLR